MDKKKADLEKYGLLDYGNVKDIISREFFDGNRVGEFSVSVGKGLISADELREYLSMYTWCFLE